ncbi:hypothetical protein GGI20_000768 [Coemansia sp. BCRC 34301]|nr:hypothetical protein GGI20_000768 [Coemansia sp. BCRC 34301]
MSSTVFAAVRRATGLTFRRRLLWPPVDVKTCEKWLKWYESQMAKINETAELRIATAIERYGSEIENPAVREVWEKQLRDDVMEKVNRIKERHACCTDMLRQARERELNPGADDGRRRHSPILALYLYAGERCLDWLVMWMRGNPHFCYEPGDANGVPGSVSLESLMGPYENGEAGSAPAPVSSAQETVVARALPVPYIAVAQSLSHSPPMAETMPEPSAPTLSESQFLKLVPDGQSLPAATSSAHQGSSDANQIAQSSGEPLCYEAFEPPPYTPVDNSDAGLESESEIQDPESKTRKRAIVIDNETH